MVNFLAMVLSGVSLGILARLVTGEQRRVGLLENALLGLMGAGAGSWAAMTAGVNMEGALSLFALNASIAGALFALVLMHVVLSLK